MLLVIIANNIQTHGLRDRDRCLKVDGMSGAGDDDKRRARDAARHVVRNRPELGVALTDDQRDRHRQLAQAIPQRR